MLLMKNAFKFFFTNSLICHMKFLTELRKDPTLCLCYFFEEKCRIVLGKLKQTILIMF